MERHLRVLIALTKLQQISDLAFRRHILVQSLILIDFLLSLTPKAKAKLGSTKNKSVLYDFTLVEEEVRICYDTH